MEALKGEKIVSNSIRKINSKEYRSVLEQYLSMENPQKPLVIVGKSGIGKYRFFKR